MKTRSVLIGLSLAGFEAAGAQESRTGTETVAPAPEYEAGGLKKKILGRGWRDLWITPVRAPVFDLDTYAGGMHFIERGGGMQTLSLHFEENNGWRRYLFRSANKYPLIQAMPPAVQGTPVGAVIQDQVSTLFPASALMVPPFLEAIGVLHIKPDLVVMPREPRLGAYQDTFALMLGTMELNPHEAPDDQSGFAGSRKILPADEFLKEIEKTRGHLLDEKELFAVRLVDLMINDGDRSIDNIRFARYGEEGAYTWRPLPRDRDRAFTDARGWLIDYFIRPLYPKLARFDARVPLNGLVFATYRLDRRLLQRITRSDADQIAQRVQTSITDGVIERAIGSLPAAWRSNDEATGQLRSVLRARRDNIRATSAEFYGWLATEVDVHATNEDDRATVTRHPDGTTTVMITGKKDAPAASVFYERTFSPAETNEVRVFMQGGDDDVVVTGASNKDVLIRIIGGKGDDVLADSAGGGGNYFYDENGKNTYVSRNGTHVSEREWHAPKEGAGTRFDSPWRPDWGRERRWGPTFGFARGAGPVIGFGPSVRRYGFRRLPHRFEGAANVLIGLGNLEPGVKLRTDYRFENSPAAFIINARATKFESFSFYGYGNDTRRISPPLADVDQDIVAIEPSYVYHVGWNARLDAPNLVRGEEPESKALRPWSGRIEAGPALYWTKTHAASGSPFALEVTGNREVSGRAGARAALDVRKVNGAQVPDRGVSLKAEAAAFPEFWGVKTSFATGAVDGAVYVPVIGNGLHFAFRAGAQAATDGVPALHAPAIGGRTTLRGYSWRRYTGESAATGSAELRVPLGSEIPLLIKWKSGVFALADAGRVRFHGGNSGGWHTAVGGGIWLAALGQTLSVAYARGEKGGIYVTRGLSF